MRSYGFLGDTRAREIEGVGAVSHVVSSNVGVGLAFLQAKYLGTLEVGTTSIGIVTAFEVKENLLSNNKVTNTLSTTLCASKLELLFVGAIAPNATL